MEVLERIKQDAKNRLSEERYQHSLGVMEKAKELAKQYGVDEKTAELVGIAHDIAKEIPEEQRLEYVTKNQIVIDEIERKNTSLLHGKIGADIAKKEYQFTEEMQQAILAHTTGILNMTILDKIIFIADKIEKNRVYSDVDKVRELAKKDLDEAMLYILNYTIKNNIDKKKLIHPNSVLVRNEIFMKKYC